MSERLEALRRVLVELLDAAAGPVQRIRVRQGDASIEVEWPDQRPQAAPPEELPDGPAPSREREPGTHLIRAPMVGTFYRAQAPGAPPFVAVGDVVAKGHQVGILEAMKLMNRIAADRAGTIAEILVEDATPVEYDQPLLAMLPADSRDHLEASR